MTRRRWTSGRVLRTRHFATRKKVLAHDMANETPHGNRHRRLYSDRLDHRHLARGAVQPIRRSSIISSPERDVHCREAPRASVPCHARDAVALSRMQRSPGRSYSQVRTHSVPCRRRSPLLDSTWLARPLYKLSRDRAWNRRHKEQSFLKVASA
jgi:hypothetical protein